MVEIHPTVAPGPPTAPSPSAASPPPPPSDTSPPRDAPPGVGCSLRAAAAAGTPQSRWGKRPSPGDFGKTHGMGKMVEPMMET